MVKIEHFRFAFNLGCGEDVWLPFGRVYDHPNFENGEEIFTASPVDFDEKTLIMQTASGRSYQIMSFESDDKKKWITEINNLIGKNN